MSTTTDIATTPLVSLAFADALERELDDGALLTVGSPRGSISEVVGDEPVQVVELTFTTGDGAPGTIAFVAVASFAEVLQNAAADELLITPCGPALGSTVRAIGTLLATDVESDAPRRVDLESIEAAQGDNEMVVFPILNGTLLVGCLAVIIDAWHASMTPMPERPPTAVEGDAVRPLDPRNSSLLADVEMGVTAELGRCRMSVREFMSLTSGAVIDLDRPVGAPVDIVVNGTPIARGEVVVIDEEFGVRITEILKQAPSSH